MTSLDDMIGQDRIKKLLAPEISVAMTGQGVLANCLFHGPAGTGKSSIVRAIAETCGYEMREWVVGSDWTAARVETELFDLPTCGYTANGLPTGKDTPTYLLFLDEIHNLKLSAAEALYEPMITNHVVSNGGKHWLPRIVFMGATTKISAVPLPMKTRFGLHLHVDPYTQADLVQIVGLAFPLLDKKTTFGVAQRSKGIPRVALMQAQRVQNFGGLAWYDAAGIDDQGLDLTDLRYLEILTHARRPLSLSTLAAMTGEPASTITEMVEPYLLSLGLVEITSAGRKIASTGRGLRG